KLLRSPRVAIARPSSATSSTAYSLDERRHAGADSADYDGRRLRADQRHARFDQGKHVTDGHRPPELEGERGDARVDDAAGDARVGPRQVTVGVEREAVHRHVLADPDADRTDLAVRPALVGAHPDA